MTPAERVNQSSGSAAHTVPFLLSRQAPLRVLPTATAQFRATPRSARLRTRVLGSFHCVQMKDAGKKAALTRKHSAAGRKAAETRKRNRDSTVSEPILPIEVHG